jgi:hypothetical protein
MTGIQESSIPRKSVYLSKFINTNKTLDAEIKAYIIGRLMW